MTGKQFINNISHSKRDFLLEFINILKEQKIQYCLIGGLAVNAYAEPVVSLDMDIVVISTKIAKLLDSLPKGYKTMRQKHSVNISVKFSDLRIQIQTDERYQSFIKRAVKKDVLGYKIQVAKLEDLLKGKLWAYNDPERRLSKKQKDLSDIFRLAETHKHLIEHLPKAQQNQLKP